MAKRGSIPRRQFLNRSAVLGTGLVAASRLRAFQANDRIGIGVIGCGGRGNAHAHAYKAIIDGGFNAAIVAVCDVYGPRLNRAAEAYKAKAYLKHQELLADENVDVVSIATPDHVHGYQTIDAAQAHKDIYCEKPFTHWRQFEITKRAVAEVKKNKVIFQIGTQGMSDGAWHQAAQLIKEGAIGKPIHAECGYFRVGDWGERGMQVDDQNAKPGPDLDWKAFLCDAPDRPFDASRFFRWRMYEEYSGGPVTDLFPHSLTPVAFMLGLTWPEKVVAVGGKHRYEEREVPDTFNMLVEYPQDVTVAVLGTQANDYSGTGDRGAGGRCPTIRGWEGSITFEGNELWVRPIGDKPEVKKVPIEHGEDWIRYFRNFLECCAARRPTAAGEDMALHVQTTLQMAMLSFRRGASALFDPIRQTIVV